MFFAANLLQTPPNFQALRPYVWTFVKGRSPNKDYVYLAGMAEVLQSTS